MFFSPLHNLPNEIEVVKIITTIAQLLEPPSQNKELNDLTSPPLSLQYKTDPSLFQSFQGLRRVLKKGHSQGKGSTLEITKIRPRDVLY